MAPRLKLTGLALSALFACEGGMAGDLPGTGGGAPNGGGLASGGGGGSGGGSVETGGGMEPAAGGAGGGTLASGRVPMFIAQGHLGRTTISCDLGRTWVADRDDAPPNSRCWQLPPGGGTQIECDHTAISARGLAFGATHAVANFGWGAPGTLRRTANGVDWETVQTGRSYASTVWTGDRFLAMDWVAWSSDDDGQTWSEASGFPDLGNARRGGAGDLDGGVFVRSADRGLAVSWDGGAGWFAPPVSASCGAGMTLGGVVFGNGRIVVAGSNGVCSSSDRGATWVVGDAGATVDAFLVFDGTQFVTWGSDSSYTRLRLASRDGLSWSTARTSIRRPDGGVSSGNGPSLGAVAYGAGVFAASNSEWPGGYEAQRFYRSTDGLVWDELPPGAFKASHPIIHLAFGEGERSAVCP